MAGSNDESQYINGTPLYHEDKKAQYVLPTAANSFEHDRLVTQAKHLSAIMNGRIIHSPVNTASVKGVLDVGCGTGVVTEWLAKEYPDADVVGLDLSPVPDVNVRPSNVRFVQGNILTDRDLLGQEIFDLTFSRLLVCGMNDWKNYISSLYDLIKPGGWAEVHDLDWIWYDKQDRNISDGWPWWCRLRSVGEARGLDFSCGSRARRWMEDAGFEQVQVTTYRWPFGGQWEKDEVWREFGDYGSRAMVEMTWHMIPRLMEGEADANQKVIEEMRQQMKADFAPAEGKHWVFYVTCGRKPE